MPISVGYQSGSHYFDQALEQFPLDEINLSFKDGLVFGAWRNSSTAVPACAVLGPYYFAEQLGFRKVLDCTFAMATMLTGDPDMEDVRSSSALSGGRKPTSICGRAHTKYYAKGLSASRQDGHAR